MSNPPYNPYAPGAQRPTQGQYGLTNYQAEIYPLEASSHLGSESSLGSSSASSAPSTNPGGMITSMHPQTTSYGSGQSGSTHTADTGSTLDMHIRGAREELRLMSEMVQQKRQQQRAKDWNTHLSQMSSLAGAFSSCPPSSSTSLKCLGEHPEKQSGGGGSSMNWLSSYQTSSAASTSNLFSSSTSSVQNMPPPPLSQSSNVFPNMPPPPLSQSSNVFPNMPPPPLSQSSNVFPNMPPPPLSQSSNVFPNMPPPPLSQSSNVFPNMPPPPLSQSSNVFPNMPPPPLSQSSNVSRNMPPPPLSQSSNVSRNMPPPPLSQSSNVSRNMPPPPLSQSSNVSRNMPPPPLSQSSNVSRNMPPPPLSQSSNVSRNMPPPPLSQSSNVSRNMPPPPLSQSSNVSRNMPPPPLSQSSNVSRNMPPPPLSQSSNVSRNMPPPPLSQSSNVSRNMPPPPLSQSSNVSRNMPPPPLSQSSNVSRNMPPPPLSQSSNVSRNMPPPPLSQSSNVSRNIPPPPLSQSSNVSQNIPPPRSAQSSKLSPTSSYTAAAGGSSRITSNEQGDTVSSKPGLAVYSRSDQPSSSLTTNTDQPRFTFESATNILQNFGLENEDLQHLNDYPEDKLTPENLPFILRDILHRKTKKAVDRPPQKNRVASGSDHFGASGAGPISPPKPHEDRRTHRSKSPRRTLRSKSPKSITVKKPPSVPLKQAERPEQSSQSILSVFQKLAKEPISPPMEDEDKQTLKSKPSKSDLAKKPSPTTPSPPRLTLVRGVNPDRPGLVVLGSQENDGNKAKEDTGQPMFFPPMNMNVPPPPFNHPFFHMMFPPPPLAFMSVPPPPLNPPAATAVAKGLPTPAVMSDYSAITPRIFPHTCSLCNIECIQMKNWISHQNSCGHIESCRLIRKKYPEWKGQITPAARDVHSHSGSRSRSPSPRRYTQSRSPGSRRYSRSQSRSPRRYSRSRSRSPRPYSRSRYASPGRYSQSRSPSSGDYSRSGGSKPRRYSRSRSPSPLLHHDDTPSKSTSEAREMPRARSRSPRSPRHKRSSPPSPSCQSRSSERRSSSKSSSHQQKETSAERLAKNTSAAHSIPDCSSLDNMEQTPTPALVTEFTRMKSSSSSPSSSKGSKRSSSHPSKGQKRSPSPSSSTSKTTSTLRSQDVSFKKSDKEKIHTTSHPSTSNTTTETLFPTPHLPTTTLHPLHLGIDKRPLLLTPSIKPLLRRYKGTKAMGLTTTSTAKVLVSKAKAVAMKRAKTQQDKKVTVAKGPSSKAKTMAKIVKKPKTKRSETKSQESAAEETKGSEETANTIKVKVETTDPEESDDSSFPLSAVKGPVSTTKTTIVKMSKQSKSAVWKQSGPTKSDPKDVKIIPKTQANKTNDGQPKPDDGLCKTSEHQPVSKDAPSESRDPPLIPLDTSATVAPPKDAPKDSTTPAEVDMETAFQHSSTSSQAANGASMTNAATGQHLCFRHPESMRVEGLSCNQIKSRFDVMGYTKMGMITNLPDWDNDEAYTHLEVVMLLEQYGYIHREDSLYILPHQRMAFFQMPYWKDLVELMRALSRKPRQLRGSTLIFHIVMEPLNFSLEAAYTYLMGLSNGLAVDMATLKGRLVIISGAAMSYPRSSEEIWEAITAVARVRNYLPLMDRIYVEFESVEDMNSVLRWSTEKTFFKGYNLHIFKPAHLTVAALDRTESHHGEHSSPEMSDSSIHRRGASPNPERRGSFRSRRRASSSPERRDSFRSRRRDSYGHRRRSSSSGSSTCSHRSRHDESPSARRRREEKATWKSSSKGHHGEHSSPGRRDSSRRRRRTSSSGSSRSPGRSRRNKSPPARRRRESSGSRGRCGEHSRGRRRASSSPERRDSIRSRRRSNSSGSPPSSRKSRHDKAPAAGRSGEENTREGTGFATDGFKEDNLEPRTDKDLNLEEFVTVDEVGNEGDKSSRVPCNSFSSFDKVELNQDLSERRQFADNLKIDLKGTTEYSDDKPDGDEGQDKNDEILNSGDDQEGIKEGHLVNQETTESERQMETPVKHPQVPEKEGTNQAQVPEKEGTNQAQRDSSPEGKGSQSGASPSVEPGATEDDLKTDVKTDQNQSTKAACETPAKKSKSVRPINQRRTTRSSATVASTDTTSETTAIKDVTNDTATSQLMEEVVTEQVAAPTTEGVVGKSDHKVSADAEMETSVTQPRVPEKEGVDSPPQGPGDTEDDLKTDVKTQQKKSTKAASKKLPACKKPTTRRRK